MLRISRGSWRNGEFGVLEELIWWVVMLVVDFSERGDRLEDKRMLFIALNEFLGRRGESLY